MQELLASGGAGTPASARRLAEIKAMRQAVLLEQVCTTHTHPCRQAN